MAVQRAPFVLHLKRWQKQNRSVRSEPRGSELVPVFVHSLLYRSHPYSPLLLFLPVFDLTAGIACIHDFRLKYRSLGFGYLAKETIYRALLEGTLASGEQSDSLRAGFGRGGNRRQGSGTVPYDAPSPSAARQGLRDGGGRSHQSPSCFSEAPVSPLQLTDSPLGERHYTPWFNHHGLCLPQPQHVHEHALPQHPGYGHPPDAQSPEPGTLRP